jgi:hypothetical protein
MNKIARYIGGVGGFLIGYATYRYYPGIFLQFVIALVLYWAGKKVVKKVLVANSSKDELRKKWAYVLYGLSRLPKVLSHIN